jgi:hypothetical protein
MGIYLETGQNPEFSRIPPENVLTVDVGTIAIGSIHNSFRSEGFDLCSGIAIKDPFEETFGFFHVFPGQGLLDDDIETLLPLADGHLCLIQGSKSTEKRRMLRDLFTILGIEHTHTIPIDTRAMNGTSLNFHAVYRPAENQVLVARISHKDILTFPAFPG